MSLILPLWEWPEADRLMWEALLRTAGPLDDPGRLSHLRATTHKSLRLRYGQWLRWLKDKDPSALDLPPAERSTLPRLQAWLADLAHVRPMTRWTLIEGTLRVLRAAAPDRDWSPQGKLVIALKRQAGDGDRSRKQGRVLSTRVLLDAGLRHATLGADGATTELEAMKRRRDGTMIALLALLPMRRRAFAHLRLDHSVHLTDDAIHITLPGELMKNNLPWETIVPDEVAPLLRRYVTEVRPWFLARGQLNHDFLWVCKFGQPLGYDYMGPRIAELTRKLLGVSIPPHFFRDAAATTLARISPDSARLIRPILAHSGFRTAERHYIHAQTIEAGRDYAALVRKLKGDP
jgi:integrase